MTEAELIAALRERVEVQLRSEDRLLDPPLDGGDLRRAEDALGAPLPPFLGRMVQEMGNGGRGPGYGLYSLIGPRDALLSMALQELEESSVTWTTGCREDGWPGHLLLLADWGCNVHSVLDLKSGRVGLFDFSSPENVDDLSPAPDSIRWQTTSLQEWLERWPVGEELFFSLDGKS